MSWIRSYHWIQGSRLSKDPLHKEFLDAVRQLAIERHKTPGGKRLTADEVVEHITWVQDKRFTNIGYEPPDHKTILSVMKEAIDAIKNKESLDITPFAVANWIDQRSRGESPTLVAEEFTEYTEMLYQGELPYIPPHIIRVLGEFISNAWQQEDRDAIRCYIEFIGAEPWLNETKWIRYAMTEFNEPTEAFKKLVELSKPDSLRDMEDEDYLGFRGNAIPLKMTPTKVYLYFEECGDPNAPAQQWMSTFDTGMSTNPFEDFGYEGEIDYNGNITYSHQLIMTKRTIDMVTSRNTSHITVIDDYGEIDI